MRCFLFLVIFICFFINTSIISCAYTIEGGISYTVNGAREIAFKDVPYEIKIEKYKKHFVDTNFDKNIKVMNSGKKIYKDRYLTRFSKGQYAIRYRSNPDIAFYYNVQGDLYSIDIDTNNSYPKQRLSYNNKGILDTITLDTSVNEQFVFDTNKKLIAHWIGGHCYNEYGELIDTRK